LVPQRATPQAIGVHVRASLSNKFMGTYCVLDRMNNMHFNCAYFSGVRLDST